jgi:alpha-galactosidase
MSAAAHTVAAPHPKQAAIERFLLDAGFSRQRVDADAAVIEDWASFGIGVSAIERALLDA